MEEVKQGGVPQKERSRDQIIIKTSITGIIANVFLAGFKAFVGAAYPIPNPQSPLPNPQSPFYFL